ncbi:MAG: PEP-CTERM sorting domain-containing protein [Acidobacteriota bacterium]
MKSTFLAHTISATVLVITLAATASATVTYNTDSIDSKFVGFGQTLSSTSGPVATLTYQGIPDFVTGVPSSINLGAFQLECDLCSTQENGLGATFDSFVFNLVLNSTASGTFVGTSTGGQVFSDASAISILWSPLTLGPGTNNADSGDFGATFFTTSNFTPILAPNAGGQTTVEGFVDEVAAPEPSTYAMVSAALVGMWFTAKRRNTRGK